MTHCGVELIGADSASALGKLFKNVFSPVRMGDIRIDAPRYEHWLGVCRGTDANHDVRPLDLLKRASCNSARFSQLQSAVSQEREAEVGVASDPVEAAVGDDGRPSRVSGQRLASSFDLSAPQTCSIGLMSCA